MTDQNAVAAAEEDAAEASDWTPRLRQRLSLAIERLDGVVDALGHRIDPGILQAVAMLNEFGINTNASCEGHEDWATGGPYIDIASPQYPAMRREFRSLGDDPALADAKARLREKMKIANAVEGQKILPILDDFYRARATSHQRRIGLWFYGPGITRLESVGVAFLGAESDSATKVDLLHAFQAEMRAFSRFLVSYEPPEPSSRSALGAGASSNASSSSSSSSSASPASTTPFPHRLG